MKTNVYIDGFNFYNRAVKDTPYKWLDLRKLAQALVPSHQVNRIRYFTALVHPRPPDMRQPQRQQVYLRALAALPGVSLHYGLFRVRKKRRPLAGPGNPPTPGAHVDIVDTEEKGTDVNLATYLLIDGFNRDYEQALVISNDADLALPIQMVRDNLGLPIGVVNPNRDPRAGIPKELRAAATFARGIRQATLARCLLPATLTDSVGSFTKPASW